MFSLTGTLSSLPDLVAASVEPMTGRLAASRLTLVLVPAILLLVPILFRLIPDLGRCRISQAFMVLGLVALVSCVGIHVNRTTSIHPAVSQILFLSGSFFVFAASLLHARFVMYISHDPPARRIRKPTPPHGQLHLQVNNRKEPFGRTLNHCPLRRRSLAI